MLHLSYMCRTAFVPKQISATGDKVKPLKTWTYLTTVSNPSILHSYLSCTQVCGARPIPVVIGHDGGKKKKKTCQLERHVIK